MQPQGLVASRFFSSGWDNKKLRKRFYSFSRMTKLFFLSLFFAVLYTITAHDPSNDFILIHDEECKEDRSVADALLDSKLFSKEDVADFQKQLSALVEGTRAERRLCVSPDSVENHVSRRLSGMNWEDRRDQIISALDFRVHKELHHNLSINQTFLQATSVSRQFLKHVGMDIIDDSLMPGSQIFSLAAKLPCLLYPPQRNEFYHQSSLPNDLKPSEDWHLGTQPGGIGATKAWECNTGQRNGPVVAVSKHMQQEAKF